MHVSRTVSRKYYSIALVPTAPHWFRGAVEYKKADVVLSTVARLGSRRSGPYGREPVAREPLGIALRNYSEQVQEGKPGTGHGNHSHMSCAVCGEAFTPRQSTALYCSKQCKGRASWDARKRRQPTKPCEYCGEAFTMRPNDGSNRYCSRRCYWEAGRVPKVCAVEFGDCVDCGAAYVMHGNCSRCSRCEWIYHLPWRQLRWCAICGGEFITTARQQRYCSVRCRNQTGSAIAARVNNDKRRAKRRAFLREAPRRQRRCLRWCLTCDSEFITTTQRRPKRYCSYACSLKSAKSQASRDRAKLKRRGYESSGDRIVRREVFERDLWICGLCGRMTQPSAKVPHPMAPTVDHVVPLSRGGAHAYDNVQTAHFVCNSRKGNKLY